MSEFVVLIETNGNETIIPKKKLAYAETYKSDGKLCFRAFTKHKTKGITLQYELSEEGFAHLIHTL